MIDFDDDEIGIFFESTENKYCYDVFIVGYFSESFKRIAAFFFHNEMIFNCLDPKEWKYFEDLESVSKDIYQSQIYQKKYEKHSKERTDKFSEWNYNRLMHYHQEISDGYEEYNTIKEQINKYEIPKIQYDNFITAQNKIVKGRDLRIHIEIKPSLGDDYISIFRKMPNCDSILVYKRFTASGATLEEVKKIFATKNITLVNELDIENYILPDYEIEGIH